MVLKGYSYEGHPYTHCMCPVPFGGKDGFDMDESHVFPQEVLAVNILVGGWGCKRRS